MNEGVRPHGRIPLGNKGAVPIEVAHSFLKALPQRGGCIITMVEMKFDLSQPLLTQSAEVLEVLSPVIFDRIEPSMLRWDAV
jgi:hypothetical protein